MLKEHQAGLSAAELFCRRCYDHLAGQVGVAVAHALQDRDFIRAAPDKLFTVTPAGTEWFRGIGMDVPSIKPTKRGLARQCLDWTERRHHLAGPLGVAMMATMCTQGWLKRSQESRAVLVTPKGWAELKRHFGLEKELILR